MSVRNSASKSTAKVKENVLPNLNAMSINRIHRIDAIQGLKRLPDKSVDLIVTDPPYNIASKIRLTMKKGKPVSTEKMFGRWDQFHPFDYDVFIMQVISECYRILKPGGSMYMFTSRENNGYFIRQAIARGFTYRNQLAIIKTNVMPSFSKKNWRSAFEVCFYVTKDKAKTFNFISQPACKNVYIYSIRHKQSNHPTEKPLEFIKLLVEVSSNRGDLVLDPFMGSGTTAVACKQLGRNFIGFDLEKEYIKMANLRLKGGGVTKQRRPQSMNEENQNP